MGLKQHECNACCQEVLNSWSKTAGFLVLHVLGSRIIVRRTPLRFFHISFRIMWQQLWKKLNKIQQRKTIVRLLIVCPLQAAFYFTKCPWSYIVHKLSHCRFICRNNFSDYLHIRLFYKLKWIILNSCLVRLNIYTLLIKILFWKHYANNGLI